MTSTILPFPFALAGMPAFKCPEGTKMHILDLGHLQMDEAWLLYGANGSTLSNLNPTSKRRDLIVLAGLIEYPGFGCILFETGCAEDIEASWDQTDTDVLPRTCYTENQKLPAAIRATGNDIKDVKAVVFGHLHPDHAGGLEHFIGTNVPIYVHEQELKHACWSIATGTNPGAYLTAYMDLERLNWKTFDNESMILCQGITLYHSPGHTPGLCIMQVNLEKSGTFIWTTDQFHIAENFEQRHPQGWLVKDHRAWLKSLDMIERLQRMFHATMIFGHDKEVAEKLMGKVYT